LNASQSRHTMASRFLDDFFGSGVQQIALATEDIFRTVQQLRANGIELLPIPENYYDDLEARTDLDATQIDRLRAGNILYDRDGGGLAPQVVHRNVVGLACGPGRDRGDDADCRVEQRHRHPCIWALALDGDGYDWRNPDVIIAGLPKAGAATSAISWRAGASPE